MSETRDIEASPYSPDEGRVAAFFVEAGAGGGDDPIGYLIAAHRYAMGEWQEAQTEIVKLRAALALADRAFSTISTSNGAVREAQAAIRALNT